MYKKPSYYSFAYFEICHKWMEMLLIDNSICYKMWTQMPPGERDDLVLVSPGCVGFYLSSISFLSFSVKTPSFHLHPTLLKKIINLLFWFFGWARAYVWEVNTSPLSHNFSFPHPLKKFEIGFCSFLQSVPWTFDPPDFLLSTGSTGVHP